MAGSTGQGDSADPEAVAPIGHDGRKIVGPVGELQQLRLARSKHRRAHACGAKVDAQVDHTPSWGPMIGRAPPQRINHNRRMWPAVTRGA